MKLAIIGTGYVGLVTGTCFAEMGNQVTCVDIDAGKIEKLRRGKLTIFEPGLELIFERNLREDRLHFTTQLAEAVTDSEVVFLALPTPKGGDGSADLSFVLGVAREIGKLIAAEENDAYKVIVNKSTVPVGTADLVRSVIEEAGLAAGERFDVVSNPEFLREGLAVDDFLKPERVVIGSSSSRAQAVMHNLYEPFVRNGNPILNMDERSSELTKYAANAFLATKITFMNEVANLCERVGANVEFVRHGIGTDSRIGKQFLYAGIGYGGSCFPKDVHALKRTAATYDYEFPVLDAVIRVNDRQHDALVSKVVSYFDGSLENRHFAVWGLAFKANTDDVRESPAHAVINALLAQGATITAFDPEAIETTRAVLGDTIAYAHDIYDALKDADALIVCTEWNEFRQPDFTRLKATLKQSAIFDGRNLFNPQTMAESGFDYFSIGRPQQFDVTTAPDGTRKKAHAERG
ncbi:MAG: UDP-glucose/GDP-mannose dehydrogenase family protein [Pyrinomonadaceae bacterium MAG19_C2-C3]|nr:UDP-glucose/GDP-mannose dehydrogenase family protein [Pyrinomonadaceae bacterium MAG19_C2-C3]